MDSIHVPYTSSSYIEPELVWRLAQQVDSGGPYGQNLPMEYSKMLQDTGLLGPL